MTRRIIVPDKLMTVNGSGRCPRSAVTPVVDEGNVELGVEHSPVNDQGGYAVLVFRDAHNIQLEFMSMG
jgi:hypothetical protein